MRITKIKISNFRLLTELTVELEENLSLIIGKNNTGKTSLVHVLDKFLNNREFLFEDFNINLCTALINSIEADLKKGKLNPLDYEPHKINLQIFIKYSDTDDLSRISKLIMDLEPSNDEILLSLDYFLKFEKYKKLIGDFKIYQQKINQSRDTWQKKGNRKVRKSQIRIRLRKPRNEITRKDIHSFIKQHHAHYFERQRLSLDIHDNKNSHELSHDELKEIIGIQIIDAKRDVANTEGAAGKTLSKLSSLYYRTQDKSGPNDPQSVTDLQLQLARTDSDLTDLYSRLFEPVIKSVKQFATTTKHNEAELTIQSLLRETSLFEENTFVSYQHGSYHLPESYNGLGYMNLFSIIFDIHIKLGHLKKVASDSEKAAEINLLCIEEPEAHTHPQMQYVFIKNIKTLLDDEGRKEINLQTIMTTHSSHIVSQSDFEDIKYFYRIDENTANVKNMRDLKENYSAHSEWFNYLKRYLTLNNSELFFADKAIFLEGTTERILLPLIMHMTDISNSTIKEHRPLLSQNISIVETGNYSHVFDEFIKFLGIKTLIITDIDSKDSNNEKCEASKGVATTNASINYFLGVLYNELLCLTHKQKILSWNGSKYVPDQHGIVCIAYQTNATGYHGRTFEDAFIGCVDNLKFICEHKDSFLSLKNRGKLDPQRTDYFNIAHECIDQKSSFASDIYYHTNAEKNNWTIPAYIREGLEWLAR